MLEIEEDKPLVLIVEDSSKIKTAIEQNVHKLRYDFVSCSDKMEVYKAFSKFYFSLVIIDIDSSEIDGMEILRHIRLQNEFLPVFLLSSDADSSSKIKGFKEGCDDYIVKPFHANELFLRMKRTVEKFEAMDYKKRVFLEVCEAGKFKIDISNGMFTKDNKQILLRKKQFDIMAYFIQNPNKLLPFSAIYENVWKEKVLDVKTLESNMYVNIRELRRAIEDNPKKPSHIISVSKFGYMFVPC